MAYTYLTIHPERNTRQRFKVDSVLNHKVSIWRGCITYIQADAIVNSAAKPQNGGQGQYIMVKVST